MATVRDMFRTIVEAAIRKATGRGTTRRVQYDAETGKVSAEFDLEIIIYEDELDGGYVARCVNLPGAASQGETVEEALENLSDAIGGVIATRFERHLPSPPPLLDRSLYGHDHASQVTVPVPLKDERDRIPA